MINHKEKNTIPCIEGKSSWVCRGVNPLACGQDATIIYMKKAMLKKNLIDIPMLLAKLKSDFDLDHDHGRWDLSLKNSPLFE